MKAVCFKRKAETEMEEKSRDKREEVEGSRYLGKDVNELLWFEFIRGNVDTQTIVQMRLFKDLQEDVAQIL